MAKKFWLIIERGSYVVTLLAGLVEILHSISSGLY